VHSEHGEELQEIQQERHWSLLLVVRERHMPGLKLFQVTAKFTSGVAFAYNGATTSEQLGVIGTLFMQRDRNFVHAAYSSVCSAADLWGA
jgi:hypothetical protein